MRAISNPEPNLGPGPLAILKHFTTFIRAHTQLEFCHQQRLCSTPLPLPTPPPETTTATIKYAVYFNTLPVHLWGGWGRRGEGGGDGQSCPHPAAFASTPTTFHAPAPARRLPHAWSCVSFVPEHPGEILFVQGWSCRVLWTMATTMTSTMTRARLPEGEGPRQKQEGVAAPMATNATNALLVSGLSRSGSEVAVAAQGAAALGGGGGGGGGGRVGLADGSRIVALDGHKAQVN